MDNLTQMHSPPAFESLQFYPPSASCGFLLVQTGFRILLVLWDKGDFSDFGYGVIVDWRTGERGKVREDLASFVLSVGDYDCCGNLPTARPSKSSPTTTESSRQ